MKNYNKITFILCFFTLLSYSQESKVEKNIYGGQIGVYGIWAYNETQLIHNTVLRTEIGTDIGFGKNFFIANPSITIEPKWYYNIKKRQIKGKDIKNNSANFISLQTKYYLDNIIKNNQREEYNLNNILKSNITWGIRRNINNSLNYETGFGLGIQRNFKTNNFESSINIHLRFGLGW
ncbi:MULTISPECIES: hypothetical protein [Wenyingzhuangia]|uniref:hypothetical protein n=1 Tax=Wenyingzhuangia TaxID=1518147 RepID=UPI00143BA7B0|nr:MULTISPECIES: hypothetical protein [Wenyingzhuangia]MDO6736827.1 hypothetical protein [Wenyingzhuangia sp. 2_MG-2023]NJB81526.1 hypothetical protein [Wenyingzhuangia aestuarii]